MLLCTTTVIFFTSCSKDDDVEVQDSMMKKIEGTWTQIMSQSGGSSGTLDYEVKTIVRMTFYTSKRMNVSIEIYLGINGTDYLQKEQTFDYIYSFDGKKLVVMSDDGEEVGIYNVSISENELTLNATEDDQQSFVLRRTK